MFRRSRVGDRRARQTGENLRPVRRLADGPSHPAQADDRDHLRRISMLDREAMVGFSEKEEETLLSLLTRIRDNIDSKERS